MMSGLASRGYPMVGLDAALTDAFEAITKRAETDRRNSFGNRGVLTGFKDIDQALGGILPGELVVVAGKTGTGKTAFSLNVAVNAAKAGAEVLLFTPAHDPVEIATRMIVSEAHVDARKVDRGYISEGDWRAIADASNRLAPLSLRICSSPWTAPSDVLDAIRDCSSESRQRLVIFDGIEWMASNRESCLHDRSEAIGWAALQMKRISRAEGVCALATTPLAQGSGPFSSAEEPACPEDMLDGFQGAQDAADALFLLDRDTCPIPQEAGGRAPLGSIANMRLVKSRRTPKTSITLAFVPERIRFVDYADDIGVSARRRDDRVGEIALGLGWDRESVVDALDSLYEDGEVSEACDSLDQSF